MYQIKMTCFDPPYNETPSYFDTVNKRFERKCEAYHELLICAIDEAQELNAPDTNYMKRTNIFVLVRDYVHEGKKYPAAIIMWDGALGIKEQSITLYDIVWENENPLDPWNKKLRDKFGEDITFGLHSMIIAIEEEDEDGNPVVYTEKYYYEGLVTGKSKLYDTIEEAYEEACWFMDHIEWFVDED
jgi:hypothetical protein